MFSKPFRIKSNTQLKGSERKRLRTEILKSFPSLAAEDLLEMIPNKDAISSLKVITHSNEIVQIYTTEKFPFVFELETVMYPTIYFLWHFPNLLHFFTTYAEVFTKIKSGADLMLPGIYLKTGSHINAYGKFEKGEKLSVNITTNKAPIAVGKAANSSFDMYMSGNRGKAVIILHYYGDLLCSLGTKAEIPELGPPYEPEEDDMQSKNTNHENMFLDNITESLVNIDVKPFTDLCSNFQHNLILSKDSASATFIDASPQSRETEGDCAISLLDSSNSDMINEHESVVQPCVGTSSETAVNVNENEMDKLLMYCFLKALKTTVKDIKLPLLTSNFFKLHMIPACPSSSSLDVKKSSYKKLSKYLSNMEEQNIITVKELTKGVDSIVSVNHNHQLLREFFLHPDDSLGDKCEGRKDAMQPEINEMYVATAAALPVLSEFLVQKGDSLSLSSVRRYLTEYVKKHQLQDPLDRRLVKLNGSVLQSCLKTTENSVSWEYLITTFLSLMTRSYQMKRDKEISVITKGKLEAIDIQVARRTGNKKVTLVNNLELYGIDIQKFSHDCQHGVAASTSISNVPGKKSAQLMVQGNQVTFVGNLLTDKYKIPKRYIRGLEAAVKPKKK